MFNINKVFKISQYFLNRNKRFCLKSISRLSSNAVILNIPLCIKRNRDSVLSQNSIRGKASRNVPGVVTCKARITRCKYHMISWMINTQHALSRRAFLWRLLDIFWWTYLSKTNVFMTSFKRACYRRCYACFDVLMYSRDKIYLILQILWSIL